MDGGNDLMEHEHTYAANPIAHETQMDRIERKMDTILTKMDMVETMTIKVIEEVKPTIDELMNSQFVKMLGMGKKK